MIQRIQSVYLLLASLALFALFLFPLANVFDLTEAKRIEITGVYKVVGEQVVQVESFTLLTIATIILALLPLVLIFLYKNRIRQMWLVYGNAILVVAYSYWISVVLKGAVGANLQISDYGIGIGMSSISVLCLVLAARGIKRDERLIKSADRLR